MIRLHSHPLAAVGGVVWSMVLRAAMFLALCAAPALAEVPDAYRETWKALRPKLDENIERYRKGEATITIVDAQDKPVADASLAIQQKTHGFRFGCNILMLGQLGDRNEAYEQAFVKLFNLATTPFCWKDLEPQPGQLRFAEGSEEIPRRPPPDRVLAFCRKHGIAVKGQPLVCAGWYPEWAPKDPEQAKKAHQEWLAKVAERYGQEFQIFDVVNESLIRRSRTFCLYTPDVAYVDWAFRQAKGCFPSGPLLEINEGSDVNGKGRARDEYLQLVKRLVDEDAGLESVGFQFHLYDVKAHLAGKKFPPSQLLETYEKFGELGLPLFITEITIPTNVEPGAAGKALQAEVLANLYRLWFSVPKMAGIVYWNFLDGTQFRSNNLAQATAGLLDESMGEKPAYQAIYQLVHREWMTRLTAKSDAEGKAQFRGFYGQYTVQVTAGGRSQEFHLDLTKDGPESHQLTLQP
jgi:GH35 family endo-1,4-beta-xylanase